MKFLMLTLVILIGLTLIFKYNTVNKPAGQIVYPPSPVVVPKVDTASSSDFMDDLMYPKAQIIYHDDRRVDLKSLDDPKVVTQWYLSKLRDLKMNSNTNIQTNTNGMILNQLVSSSSSETIKVEITNSNSGTNVSIIVSDIV